MGPLGCAPDLLLVACLLMVAFPGCTKFPVNAFLDQDWLECGITEDDTSGKEAVDDGGSNLDWKRELSVRSRHLGETDCLTNPSGLGDLISPNRLLSGSWRSPGADGIKAHLAMFTSRRRRASDMLIRANGIYSMQRHVG